MNYIKTWFGQSSSNPELLIKQANISIMLQEPLMLPFKKRVNNITKIQHPAFKNGPPIYRPQIGYCMTCNNIHIVQQYDNSCFLCNIVWFKND